MTTNYINLLGIRESERSNREREKETARHNVRTESETNRHNLVLESLQRDSNYETRRTNLAKESLQGSANSEVVRHNLATESESIRHNRQVEAVSSVQATAAKEQALASLMNAETNRGHLDLGYEQNKIAQYNADTARINASTSYQDMINRHEVSLVNAAVNKVNATTAQRNAETAERQASTNALNALTNQGNLGETVSHNAHSETLADKRYKLDLAETITEGIRDLSVAGSNISKMINDAKDTIATYKNPLNQIYRALQ